MEPSVLACVAQQLGGHDDVPRTGGVRDYATFCGRCGTSLTYRHDDSPASIDIQTATLDAPDAFAPRREIWLDDKLAWMPRNERLEPYPRSSP